MSRASGSLPRHARHAPLVLILAFAACTSTPQAPRERDAAAKEFNPRPDAATIYVYRDESGTALEPDQTTLNADGRVIGTTRPGGFFRFNVRAGTHLLHGYGYDQGKLRLETRNGEIYLISLKTAGGTSDFRLVAPETGKRDILRCCALLETWAPGQRPLLQP